MNVLINPSRETWDDILKRPQIDNYSLESTVRAILDKVKCEGDEGVLHYVKTFDNANIEAIEAVSEAEFNEAENNVSNELKEAILLAKKNIEKFHQSQMDDVFVVETTYGVRCWRKSVGIEKVGLYIPGGTAPLFSTILMLAIPAKLAGCKEIVLCTPEGKSGIHPAMLFAAKAVGIDNVYKIGGAQAIAAMAYGTETISKVYKIFGPGNQYVTMAKMLVSTEGTAIDMPAGPSEVMVVADETANPAFVAADLLSQAEHGVDSQSVLLTNSIHVAEAVNEQLAVQVEKLSRKEIAKKSLENSIAIVMEDNNQLVDIMNDYAAEHLILEVKEPFNFSKSVVNAGSVFLGHLTPESAGDYASGTNHTLPTYGYAKAYSGVSLDSFMKKITFQEINEEGLLNIGKAIEIMAEAEKLDAHKNAVSVRLKSIEKK